jgi:hypothetical protein
VQGSIPDMLLEDSVPRNFPSKSTALTTERCRHPQAGSGHRTNTPRTLHAEIYDTEGGGEI